MIWVVRAGPGGKLVDAFHREAVVGIDVPEAGDLSLQKQPEVTDVLLEAGVPPGKAAGVAAVLFAFSQTIVPGDIVLTPAIGSSEYSVAVVEGGYEYAPDSSCTHRRSVRWLGAVLRDDVPEMYRRTLGSPMPVYRPAAQKPLLEILVNRWRFLSA